MHGKQRIVTVDNEKKHFQNEFGGTTDVVVFVLQGPLPSPTLRSSLALIWSRAFQRVSGMTQVRIFCPNAITQLFSFIFCVFWPLNLDLAQGIRKGLHLQLHRWCLFRPGVAGSGRIRTCIS